jgi:SecD/SecF fusion protein
MKSKGAVKFFAIALAVVSIFQLSFTWVTYRAEQKAKDFANGDLVKERYYLDSISRDVIYNIGFAKYTYLQCKERELNLGLDLQGGMNVTLEVSLSDLVRALANNNPDAAFNKAVEAAKEKQKTSTKDYITLFNESYNEVAPGGKLSAIFANPSNKEKIKLTSSNDEVIKYVREEANGAIDRSFQILRSRIDKFGVTQPNIQKLEGSGRILVELPGVDNPNRVRKLLQGSAKLEFYETFDNPEGFKYLSAANDILKKLNITEEKTDTGATAEVAADTTKSALASLGGSKAEPVKTDSAKAKKDTAAAAQAKSFEEFSKENPLFAYLRPYADDKGTLVEKGSSVGTAAIRDTARINAMLNRPEVRLALPNNIRFAWEYKAIGENGVAVIMHALKTGRDGGASLTGDKVVDARRDISQTGQVEVSMTMNGEGAKIWKNLTKANIGHSIAIVLDDVVYSSPNVQNEIPNGRSSITGSYTQEEAGDLANILKSGKLPAPTRIVGEAVVGPTLGKEAITSGLISFVIALIAILLFMGFYYNKAGWVADLALFANVFFVVGVLTSLGAVLTLPGIAGIVLTIGMSVDANILIFERVREELHHGGKNIKNGIADGFSHAMSSILDSNITTLLLGIILYVFGTGPIQGFATTLIIGIISSMFCAIFITRLMFDYLLEKNSVITFWTKATENTFKNININFVGNRMRYYMFSGVIIAMGVVFFFINHGFHFGVDFKGGRMYVVRFEKAMETETIKTNLRESLGDAPDVKTYGSDFDQKITTSYLIEDQAEDAEQKVQAALKAGLDKTGVKYEIISSNKVGETVSADIKSKALYAIIFSCILMFVYILVRFKKWQYGLGAVAALVHDVLVVLSCYVIFENIMPFSLEINQDFIAAILTVMGYSMTDTVVVFDRIREYLTIRNKTELDPEERNEVINNALNTTLSRTINTSLTIFFVILSIFIFGGDTIRGFSFALLIGIVIGTYSSICIATPVVIDFDKTSKK